MLGANRGRLLNTEQAETAIVSPPGDGDIECLSEWRGDDRAGPAVTRRRPGPLQSSFLRRK